MNEELESLIEILDTDCSYKEKEYLRNHKSNQYFYKDRTGIAKGLEVIVNQNRVIIEQLKIIADKI